MSGIVVIEDAGGKSTVKGIEPTGLSAYGEVNTVVLNSSTWTELATVTSIEAVGIQNRTSNYILLNFDSKQSPNGENASGQDAGATVTVTADNVGVAGNTITLIFDGVASLDTVIGTWNAANAGNTASHDGVGTEVIPAEVLVLSGGKDAYSDGWLIRGTGELFIQIRSGTLKLYGLSEPGTAPSIHIMGIG